jgi:hypothetical protein
VSKMESGCQRFYDGACNPASEPYALPCENRTARVQLYS